jgi:hypothetical protein
MNLKQPDPCQYLQDLLQELPQFPDFGPDETLEQAVKLVYEKKRIVAERREFMQTYQQVVKNILNWWNPSASFLDSIEFTGDGRVVIAGNLLLKGEDYAYFPRIIKKVTGHLSLTDTLISRIDHLEEVGGFFVSGDKNLESLASLKTVDNNLRIMDSKIEELPELEVVGGLQVQNLTTLRSIPKLRVVNGTLNMINTTDLKRLPSLKKVDILLATPSALEELPALEVVVSSINIKQTNITSLPCLRRVGLDFDAKGLKCLKEVPALEKVGNNLDIERTSIETIPNLYYVGNFFNAKGARKLSSLPVLAHVKGKMVILVTSMKKFPALHTVEHGLGLDVLEIDSFASAFPHLRLLGKDGFGVSLYTGDRRISVEVKKLAAAGKIKLTGRVEYTGRVEHVVEEK